LDAEAKPTQHRGVPARPRTNKITIEELLLRHRAIDQDQLAHAKMQQERLGGDLGRILVELGYVNEELVLRAQAHQLGIPLVDPIKSPPPPELLQYVPLQVAERFGVVPVGGNPENNLLRLATSSPGDEEANALLAKMTGFKIELAVASAKSIDTAIRRAYYGDKPAPAAGPEAEVPEVIPEIEPEPEAQGELQQIRNRLVALEKRLSAQQYAAMLARVERLEQIAESDHHALNVIGQILLDAGFITREEFKKRLTRA
jgi:hypothetical protein